MKNKLTLTQFNEFIEQYDLEDFRNDFYEYHENNDDVLKTIDEWKESYESGYGIDLDNRYQKNLIKSYFNVYIGSDESYYSYDWGVYNEYPVDDLNERFEIRKEKYNDTESTFDDMVNEFGYMTYDEVIEELKNDDESLYEKMYDENLINHIRLLNELVTSNFKQDTLYEVNGYKNEFDVVENDILQSYIVDYINYDENALKTIQSNLDNKEFIKDFKELVGDQINMLTNDSLKQKFTKTNLR